MLHKNKERAKNVVLLELGGTHAECLHTQIHYLSTNGYRVHLVCDDRTWAQIEEKHLLSGVQMHSLCNGLFQQLLPVLKIHLYVRRRHVSHIVFNTTEINAVKNLFLIPFPKRMNLTGILHNAEKLVSGRGIRYLVGKRMRKFFLLGEYLREKFEPRTEFKLSVFYPLYFPPFAGEVKKNGGDFRITVPGGIQPGRRDYAGLLEGLLKETLHPSVKLIFLGSSNLETYPEIDELLTRTKLRGTQITVFTGFVEYGEFHGHIVQSDLILPLIHPDTDRFYGDARISGAFNLSFAYKIPLLVEESMKKWTDLQGASFYYRAENLVQVINSFAERKPEVEQMRETMRNDCRWKEEHLSRKYLEFIES